MRRLFWISLGATAGVAAVRRLTQLAARLTPAGVASGAGGALGGLTEAIREFTEEVRAGMAEREGELRAAVGLDGTHDVVDAHALEVAASPFGLHPEQERPGGMFR